MNAPPLAHPLIIGHRGASIWAPENTLASFSRAISDGADGIEFDVRLARDGVPVVIHDHSLKRTGGIKTLVSELSSSELRKVNVGSWFNREHPEKAQAHYTQECVPTLARVFERLLDTPALFYLEMKCDGPGLHELCAAVVNTIREYSLAERVIVESFELRAIAEVKLMDPRTKTAALFQPRISRPAATLKRAKMVELARASGADEIALHYTLANLRVIEAAKAAGLNVVVWTVDNPDWVMKARALNIRALITNNPAKMLAARASLSAT
jgi:glycerophosphoryl diester phosphodiesterase